MPLPHLNDGSHAPPLQAWLLGSVDYALFLELQERLLFEATDAADGRITLLLCEHPAVLTIGRRGSRGHVFLKPQELVARQIETIWVNHGGGCMLHLPGQLSIYPIVPIASLGWRVGDYLRRLQHGLVESLKEIRFAPQTRPGKFGVWGRAGQLAALGVAVKYGAAYHGAHLNVCPALDLFRFLRTDPDDGTAMSSLFAEHRQVAKMTRVRETLVRCLAEAFDRPRFHIFGGHPWLRKRMQQNTDRQVG